MLKSVSSFGGTDFLFTFVSDKNIKMKAGKILIAGGGIILSSFVGSAISSTMIVQDTVETKAVMPTPIEIPKPQEITQVQPANRADRRKAERKSTFKGKRKYGFK